AELAGRRSGDHSRPRGVGGGDGPCGPCAGALDIGVVAPTRDRQAGHDVRLGLDWFAFVVAFKGVFLEGLEVVFIVITFGLAATRYSPHGLLVASASAAVAGLLVVVAGVIARRPLSAGPENTMKYAVGLLLTSFGTYRAV